jgi:hypothetical protein
MHHGQQIDRFLWHCPVCVLCRVGRARCKRRGRLLRPLRRLWFRLWIILHRLVRLHSELVSRFVMRRRMRIELRQRMRLGQRMRFGRRLWRLRSDDMLDGLRLRGRLLRQLRGTVLLRDTGVWISRFRRSLLWVVLHIGKPALQYAGGWVSPGGAWRAGGSNSRSAGHSRCHACVGKSAVAAGIALIRISANERQPEA